MDLSGEFITKGSLPDEYVSPEYYQEVKRCGYRYHHGTLTQHCRGIQLVKAMYNSEYGLVCFLCYERMPKKYRK